MIRDVRGGRVRDIEEAERTVGQLRDLVLTHQQVAVATKASPALKREVPQLKLKKP